MERIQLYGLLLPLQATPPNFDTIWHLSSLRWEVANALACLSISSNFSDANYLLPVLFSPYTPELDTLDVSLSYVIYDMIRRS
jgi:hypothetical protein